MEIHVAKHPQVLYRRLSASPKLPKERFEIALLSDDIADGEEQRRIKFFRRLIEKMSGGWRVQFFKSFGTTAGLMIDRMQKVILVNADVVLRMPYRSMINVIGRLSGMIANVYKSVKSTVGGFSEPKGIKSLSASGNGCIVLSTSPKGLRFQPDFVLSAEEQMMRIAITDTDLIISAGRRRLIHRSAVALSFHAYRIAVNVEGDAYWVALPTDVLQAFVPGSKLEFDVYAY